MNRKDNLYYVLKFALIDSFLINFMNNDFTDIVEKYKLSDKIKKQ